eukprot:g18753.t1
MAESIRLADCNCSPDNLDVPHSMITLDAERTLQEIDTGNGAAASKNGPRSLLAEIGQVLRDQVFRGQKSFPSAPGPVSDLAEDVSSFAEGGKRAENSSWRWFSTKFVGEDVTKENTFRPLDSFHVWEGQQLDTSVFAKSEAEQHLLLVKKYLRMGEVGGGVVADEPPEVERQLPLQFLGACAAGKSFLAYDRTVRLRHVEREGVRYNSSTGEGFPYTYSAAEKDDSAWRDRRVWTWGETEVDPDDDDSYPEAISCPFVRQWHFGFKTHPAKVVAEQLQNPGTDIEVERDYDEYLPRIRRERNNDYASSTMRRRAEGQQVELDGKEVADAMLGTPAPAASLDEERVRVVEVQQEHPAWSWDKRLVSVKGPILSEAGPSYTLTVTHTSASWWLAAPPNPKGKGSSGNIRSHRVESIPRNPHRKKSRAPFISFTYRFDYRHKAAGENMEEERLPRLSGFQLTVMPGDRERHLAWILRPDEQKQAETGLPEMRVRMERGVGGSGSGADWNFDRPESGFEGQAREGAGVGETSAPGRGGGFSGPQMNSAGFGFGRSTPGRTIFQMIAERDAIRADGGRK